MTMIVRNLLVLSSFITSIYADVPADSNGLCMQPWRSQFQHYNDSTKELWRWDLSTLCRLNQSYTYEGPMSTYQQFNFNVGGNASIGCSDFYDSKPQYESYGVAVQFFQVGRGTRSNADYSCLREDNVTPCPDYTFGGNMCCSVRRCEVVSMETSPYFDVLDLSNPGTGGVVLTHAGMPTSDNDGEPCPQIAPGLPRLRQFILTLLCDPNGKIDDLTITKYDENNPYCIFRVTATTKAACGILDVPASNNNLNTNTNTVGPAGQFGFTILGAFVLLGLQFGYNVYSMRKQSGRSFTDIVHAKVNSTYDTITNKSPSPSKESVPLRLSATSTGGYNSPNRFA